jgi:2-aminoadipate transaminase
MMDLDQFFSRGARGLRESAIRRAGDVRAPDLVSLAPGFPDPDLFPWDECRAITRAVLTGADPSVLQYGPTRGYRPLLDLLPEILADRGVSATSEETIITAGSQQALDLCGRVFADPGDSILVELPTYTGAITAFGNLGARLAGVRQDSEGIDLADLDEVWRREREDGRRVPFVYVVPNFQNPTGVLMSLGRRRALLEWARSRQVLILEDDPYGVLYFEDAVTSAETRPIKADDRDGLVVYASSFSKTIAPGLRVAWLAAPRQFIDKLEVAKQSADLCSGSLDQRIVHEMWTRGVLSARLPSLRAVYQRKRTALDLSLRAELGTTVTWALPKGGFFLWVRFPEVVDTEVLLGRAIERGVVYVPGRAFFVERRGLHHARLSFSWPSEERLALGVTRLAAALREELARVAAQGAAGQGSGAVREVG